MAGSRPGIRAAINARLEEVSFRTGMMAAAATLLVVGAATAALVLTVTPSHGSPVNNAAGAPAAASSPVAVATGPAAPSSPRPSATRTRAAKATASSTPEVVAQTAAEPASPADQSSSYPNSSPQSDSVSGSFDRAPASGRGPRGGYWPGRWNGAGMPRFPGGRGNFPGGSWHVGPGNRP